MARKAKLTAEYWTVFWYGSTITQCSVHKTELAAHRAARKCERAGGAPHDILKVEWLTTCTIE
jgi:hypothetical protein